MAIHVTLHESFIKELVIDEVTGETISLGNRLHIRAKCDIHNVYSSIHIEKLWLREDSKIIEIFARGRMLRYLHIYGCNCSEDMIGEIPTYTP